MDSLHALNKGDITEIKSMVKPPPLVIMTMEVSCCSRRQHATTGLHAWPCCKAQQRSDREGTCRASCGTATCSSRCMRESADCFSSSPLAGRPLMLDDPLLQAVCILKQEKPDWDTAKRVLGDAQFMKSLLEFDKDNIPDAVIRRLKKWGPAIAWLAGQPEVLH